MRIRHVILIVTLAVGCFASRLPADERASAAPAEASGIDRASCVLQLVSDPNRTGREMESQTLNALLTSTSLVDPAAEKSLHLKPDVWPKVAEIELVPAGDQAVKITVTVSPVPGVALVPDAARAFMLELANRAKVAVSEVARIQQQAQAERRAALQKEQVVARDKLDAIQSKLAMLRPNGLMDDFAMIQRRSMDRESLETSLVAQRARLGVIEEELKRIKPAQPSTSPAQNGWGEVISLREQLVETLKAQQSKGLASDVQVLEASIALAEARLSADAAASVRPAGDVTDHWTNEIISLKAGIAEAEARLQDLNSRAPKAASTQPTSPLMISQLSQDEQQARQALNDITMQLEQLNRSRSEAAPRLLILDGVAQP